MRVGSVRWASGLSTAEFGEGAVELAVEHVFVADDAGEGFGFGEGGEEGRFFAALGAFALRGVEVGADLLDLGFTLAEQARQFGAEAVFEGFGGGVGV